jgi:DNA-binding response OmpR family regulator
MTFVKLDQKSKGIIAEEKSVDLTPCEFAICAYLIRHSGSVRTRQQLIEKCLVDRDIKERSLDSAIKRLRRKLNSIDVDPIKSRYGFGYVWQDCS